VHYNRIQNINGTIALAMQGSRGKGGGEEPEIVPPQQLKDHPVGGLVLLPLGLVLADLVGDVARGDAAVSQPGRQLGAVVTPQHAIPGYDYKIGNPWSQ